MPQVKDICTELEKLAPLSYQESYDNSGLIVGHPEMFLTGLLFTLDVTEAVVAEALSRNCNMIVAHHPIVFKGLKNLNGSTYVERTVIAAIKNDIAIYAIHTNLDHVSQGVNWKIAERLGLKNVKVLAPKKQLLTKLTFFAPISQSQSILNALFDAGAGEIGDYSQCSFRTEGTGTFLPGAMAHPVVGKNGRLEEVNEHRAEVMFPSHLEHKILSILRAAHPYEEVAYYMDLLENENQMVGAGAVGNLPEPMSAEAFLSYLKIRMNVQVIKYTQPLGKPVKTVALCGGSGSFLLKKALSAQADAFVTADYKYHEFFDAENRILICDIGHYESEVFTKDLLFNYLLGKFSNFALCLSEVNTNPVKYFT